ncbi:MAG: amidohydrolase [Clostridium sp.]|uniref:amidohydrolase n=1 Tax=Clostridium sp. TaxID=1506 RepID=UPI002FCB8323
MKILIKNTSIITVNKENEVLNNTDIGIDNGKIVFIGENSDFKADKIIDGSEKVAMPGLINAHTHIPMSLLRNYANDLPLFQWLSEKIWPIEGKFTEDHIYWGSMLSIAEMIKTGTTTFNDMYFFMEDMAKAVEKTGIRASLSRGMMGESAEGDDRFNELRSLYNNYNGACNGRITVMAGPHAPYTCSDEYLESVMDIADELNIPLHIHLSESKGEVEDSYSAKGVSPIAHMENIGIFNRKTVAAHCVHLTEEDIDILKKHNVSVAYNPGSNLKLGNGFAPICSMIDKGVNVALGTDGASSNNNQNMFEEMNLASIVNKSVTGDTTKVPAMKAIEMATINGARALGIEDRVGSIEVGKNADIILVDMEKPHLYPQLDAASSMVYSAQGSDVSDVLVDGNILMENYKLTTIDFKEVKENILRLTSTLY